MGIDCPNIYEHTKTTEGSFIEGYVVLYAPAELDVVSVFTAGDDRVATLHTERVPFRRVTEVPNFVLILISASIRVPRLGE